MKVAVLTDNDFDKINGVTTTLTAVLDHAPADIQPRIFTAAALGSDQPNYLALPSIGVGIPFYREMKMYVPHWRRYLERVMTDGVDVVHLTTPGPLGWWRCGWRRRRRCRWSAAFTLIAPFCVSPAVRQEAAMQARGYALSRSWDLASPLYESYRELSARSTTRAA
jgi:hypothetical protein